MKIKAVKITIDRVEGPSHLCRTDTFEGANVWEQAQRCIDKHCETINGGYDKTDFKVWFADGSEPYEGRLDLYNPTYPKRDTSNLPDHIAQHCLFYIGVWRPSHMTIEKYQSILAGYRKYDPTMETCLRDFWLKYEIPSQWVNSVAALSTICFPCRG